ncbi:hypothetical protein [Aurantivibrio plasticivorans]
MKPPCSSEQSRVSLYSSIAITMTALFTAACSTTPSSNHSVTDFNVPRTEYGQPDLRGVWNFSSNTPLERPDEYGNRAELSAAEVEARHEAEVARRESLEQRGAGSGSGSGVGGYNQFWVESLAQGDNYRTSLIIEPKNGKLPTRVPGADVSFGGLGPDSKGELPVRFRVGGIGKDGPEQRGLSERCLKGFNSGPPFMPSMYNNNLQIFQNSDHVVILTEMIHDARVVKLQDRNHLPNEISRWSGDSIGYWEGDTLVVETSNFTDKIQAFRGTGIGSDMHLTERYTRTGPESIEYRATVDAPKAFTQPITVLFPLVKVDGEIFEYACHEGNYGMVNILQGARVEELKTQQQK